ncbi:MAG: hypothetical protein LUE11_13045 [Clostridia bacterium]|nr:hypothetical protein [Clostridia bacterium]
MSCGVAKFTFLELVHLALFDLQVDEEIQVEIMERNRVYYKKFKTKNPTYYSERYHKNREQILARKRELYAQKKSTQRNGNSN